MGKQKKRQRRRTGPGKTRYSAPPGTENVFLISKYTAGVPILNVADGVAQVSVAILGNTASKDAGSLGHVTFKVLEGFSDSTRVELTSAAYNEPITVGSDGATVIISGVSSKLTPDFTGDGQVTFPDFIQFAQNFGRKKGDANFNPRFDLSQNGSVDFPDFIQFAQAFGKPLQN